MGFGLLTGNANTDDDDDDQSRSSMVNCPGDSIQKAVDRAKRPTKIFIDGMCVEDVVITRDDITLSGNKDGETCNKVDPSASAGATIDGTITIDGVRARIEFLRVTGSSTGIDITNRADAVLVGNDVFDNQAAGIQVLRSSNAVLQDNMVWGNGRRAFDRPFIFFDSGLLVVDASSVRSDGNTYENNQYAAIDVERQSAFRNGTLPSESGRLSTEPG